MMPSDHVEPAATAITVSDLIAEWRKELGAFVHEKFSGSFSESAKHVSIYAGDTDVCVNISEGDQVTEIGRVPAQEEGIARAISALLSTSDQVSLGTRDVALQFPQTLVLRPRLQLPPASRATQRKAAFYELERLSPISAEQVYFDLVPVDNGRAAKKSEFELRIIKRATVDHAVAYCRSAGLSIGSIGFEGDAREADRRYFPVDTGAFLRLSWRRFSVVFLAALALFLLLAVLLAVYLRGAEQTDLLIAQAETASERAAVVHHLKRDIKNVRAQIEFPSGQKRAPLIVSILSELTHVLPDGTWLTEFSINGNKVHIQGFSKTASDIVGAIDKSPNFANAQFDASLQSATDNAEHFDLTFETKKDSGERR
ncbi:MAG TPA: PilN domain-containing protein [Rhizomicrobium sp.]|jgi:general secretion pathway protein L|nr:PilN domain-containing protein [Rhizomicrobium sp.]